MKFLEHGPSIPDELLYAHDEGRVVFFCGSGVSRARAKFPDFWGLARRVMDSLSIPQDSPAKVAYDQIIELEDKKIGRLISADRIFGLLEKEVPEYDIYRAIAEVLKPTDDVDLTAHKTIIDLATTPEKKVQLITTNFDLLFELSCDNKIASYTPANLSNTLLGKDIDGVVHLHGRVNQEHDNADDSMFVLSSSEFGRAYLSEGWATDYFKHILDNYYVVFIGYSADDPPVNYLLEALSKTTGKLERIYAFQSVNDDETLKSWSDIGATTIKYEENDNHSLLWETLDAWAIRSRDSDAWFAKIINMSKKGPEKLQPYERGMVAHIIKSVKGARFFSETGDKTPPPAEWLCVIDPAIRYAKPGYTALLGENRAFVDPFDLYGIDSDIQPEIISSYDYSNKRDVPNEAWDGFTINWLDLKNIRGSNYSTFRGYKAINGPNLPARLKLLGNWIVNVAHQPTTLWWAAKSNGLHPDIQNRIMLNFNASQMDSPIIRKAWLYLFEAWEACKDINRLDWYSLKRVIDKDGWNSLILKNFTSINRPRIKIKNTYSDQWKPYRWSDRFKLDDLFHIEVEYPETIHDAEIPDEWLVDVVQNIRGNLKEAVRVEEELDSYKIYSVMSISEDKEKITDEYKFERKHGLSGYLIFFASLFERLVIYDINSAIQEFNSWLLNNDIVFKRLKIWASRFDNLANEYYFNQIIVKSSDEVFWSYDYQKDLLLTIAIRWNDLSVSMREAIESRILKGPKNLKKKDGVNQRYMKSAILNRLHWLSQKGCHFTFDLDTVTKDLKEGVPNWEPKNAEEALRSRVEWGGIVDIKKDPKSLQNEPISNILTKAEDISKNSDDFLVEYDPFAGLTAEKPLLAYLALSSAAKKSEYPEKYWRKFLESEGREDDKPRLMVLTAERVMKFPCEEKIKLIHSISIWLSVASKVISKNYPKTFYKLVSTLIDIIISEPSVGKSAVVRSESGHDWALEALNSPVGKIALAMFNSSAMDEMNDNTGFNHDWISVIDKLLNLPDHNRYYALTMLSHNLHWFYCMDSVWTENNLISNLDHGNVNDVSAFWSGLFWSKKISKNLYSRIKPWLIDLSKEHGFLNYKYHKVVAGFILKGWVNSDDSKGEKLISHSEFQNIIRNADDDLRLNFLWGLKNISLSNDTDFDKTRAAITLEFIQKVWPRSKKIMTPKISANLFELAFSNFDHFKQITFELLPLLTKTGRESFTYIHIKETQEEILKIYPSQVLDLLYAILSDDVYAWPYGIGEMFDKILEADISLKNSRKYIELMRKWNNR